MSKLRPSRDRLVGLVFGGVFAALFLTLGVHIVLRLLADDPPGVGDRAPPFVLDSPIDGERVSTASLAGMVLLVDFWETTCVGCVGATPKLNRLFEKYADRGFLVLGVNREPGEEERVRAFVAERSIQYPVVVDPGFVSEQYGIYATPTVILIGGDGVIRAKHQGPVTEETLTKEIEAALDASRPDVKVGEGYRHSVPWRMTSPLEATPTDSAISSATSPSAVSST